ncbi:alpha/beta fold hydrolase [Parvularcula lutaonensis]|uniref:Alpha/beta fold hydrolase n=1 Tax=Parvularcula lutaonensis TaxID=491923 RepID=A0ABV7MBM5_9PROT|nr:alpha/beta hydrolase [Parvularcula lutaonensis]GGY44758.1 lysophospholipase [Parvularcula lutaonensis]
MSDIRVIKPPTVPMPEGVTAHAVKSEDGAIIRVLHFGGTGERGTVLCVPGWAEPAEKYGEVALDLIDRGFDVWCMDPRGQGLSQRLREDDARGRFDSFDKHIADLSAVVDYLDADRLVILAHSMGGLVTLSWLAEGGKADAVVLSAPATRIFPAMWQRAGVRALAGALCSVGLKDMPLSKEGGEAMEFEGNTLTSDPERHAILRDLLIADEALTLPRTTPAMVAAMHRQQARLHQEGALDKLSVPVLIVSLPDDTWVDSSDHENIRKLARDWITITEVPGSKHEILMERDEYRDAFWDAFDAHIAAHLPQREADST